MLEDRPYWCCFLNGSPHKTLSHHPKMVARSKHGKQLALGHSNANNGSMLHRLYVVLGEIMVVTAYRTETATVLN